MTMNQHETNKAVRAWLAKLPGTLKDVGSDEVNLRAWELFGRGDFEMFRKAMAMHGFKPEPLGRMFILRLPSKPIAG